MSASMVGLIYKISFGCMAAKSIAVKLADNSNDDGENIWPSKSSVAEACECSKRTVDRYIDLWLVLGILHLDEHGGGRRKDEERRGEKRRRGKTSVYSFNVPLLHDLKDGKTTMQDLIRQGQERGVVDSEGRAVPEAVAKLKGATGAPFDESDEQEPSADDTVQPVHPLHEGKGCNPVKERVQPSQGKGATGAPEPSKNHHGIYTPPTPPQGGGEGEASPDFDEGSGKRTRSQPNLVDEMLDRVALIPKRERVVEKILEPLCRQRKFEAPDPEYALGELADWLANREITDAECKRIVQRVLDNRKLTFRQSDVQDAAKAVVAKQADGTISINKREHPEAFAAWLRYARERERESREMRAIAYMLTTHGGAAVPSRFPPPGGAKQ